MASGNLGVLTNIGSGIYGSYQLYQNPRSVVSNLEELGFDSGLRNVFKRIQKGKDGQDSMLIVAPKEDGTKEVIRLQLPTGNVESLRQLGKERKFVIDQIENVIYLYAKNSIRIEQL